MPATFNLRSQGIVLGNPYSSRSSWRNIGSLTGSDGFIPGWIAYSPTLNQYLIGSSQVGDFIFRSNDDLQTWTFTATGIPAAQKWRGASWSPTLNLWAMSCATLGGSVIASSPDGINWTPRTLADAFFKGIIWIPEKSLFVCVTETTQFYTSPDGITWTGFNQTTARTHTSIVYSPSLDRVVTVSGAGPNNRVRYTSNPSSINWLTAVTPRLGGTNPNWHIVTWSEEHGLFVASAVGDVTVGCTMTSPDGINWTLVEFPVPTNSQGLDYSPTLGRWVVGASTGSPAKKKVRTSDDGGNWVFRKTAIDGLAAVTVVYWNSTKGIFIANNRGQAATPNLRIQFSRTGR